MWLLQIWKPTCTGNMHLILDVHRAQEIDVSWRPWWTMNALLGWPALFSLWLSPFKLEMWMRTLMHNLGQWMPRVVHQKLKRHGRDYLQRRKGQSVPSRSMESLLPLMGQRMWGWNWWLHLETVRDEFSHGEDLLNDVDDQHTHLLYVYVITVSLFLYFLMMLISCITINEVDDNHVSSI